MRLPVDTGSTATAIRVCCCPNDKARAAFPVPNEFSVAQPIFSEVGKAPMHLLQVWQRGLLAWTIRKMHQCLDLVQSTQ